jgi:hypothetical protein
MNKRTKILAGALVVLALVVAVGVGTVMAQETTPTPKTPLSGGRCGFGWGMMGGGWGGSWTTFDAVAKALGLTPEQLFSELRSGKSLEAIAEAKGVDMTAVNDAIKAAQAEAQKAAIEQAVKDGKLTREQADWLLKGYDLGLMGRGMGFGGRGHGRGGFGPFGGQRQAPGSDSTAPSVSPSPSTTRF